jgi:sulfur carrier protein
LITIQVNGEKKEVADGLTLTALLESLKLPGDRVAVELNLEIVPRNRWSETGITDGDRLEVVHFVGGGLDLRFWIFDGATMVRNSSPFLNPKSQIQNPKSRYES